MRPVNIVGCGVEREEELNGGDVVTLALRAHGRTKFELRCQ